MLIDYQLGQTSIILRVKIRNSSVTTGAGLTGLTNASTGLIISTIADNEATATAYTVAGSTIDSITTLGTFSTPTAGHCNFKEVDSTNHKGIYEIQIANARYAVSSAKSLIVSISGATNAAECDVCIPLRSTNPYDGTAGGISRIDAAISSRMATYTQPTGFLAATFPSGTVANTTNITAGTITTVTNLTNAPTSGDLTSTMKTSIGTAVWQDATAGDFTVSGSIGKSLYTSGNAPGAASGLAIVGSNMGSVSSVTGNVGGNVTGSVGSVNTAVTVGGYSAGEDPATLVLGATASSWNTSGTIGNKINSAASAGDPWTTALPGSYTSGQAGYIVGTYLDAAVSSRAATSGLPSNFGSLVISSGGVVSAQLANAVAHGGSSATLELGGSSSTAPFYVHNSGGDAVKFNASGASGSGLNTIAGGSHGVVIAGGSAGDGLHVTGALNGAYITTSGSGDGLHIASGNGNGISAAGGGVSDGIAATGGATGRGIHALGGATSGAAIRAEAQGTTSHGFHVLGADGGNGMEVNAGPTGIGLHVTGGSTSGLGISVATTSGDGLSILPTAGHAITATANGTSKHGLNITGGTGGTSDGGHFSAGTGGVDIRGSLTGNIHGTLDTLTTYTGNTPQTGDAYAVVNNGTYGNAALHTQIGSPWQVGTKYGVTLASTDVTGNLPADLQTIKTQTVTCGAGVTIAPFVGNPTHALAVDSSGYVTYNNTGVATAANQTTIISDIVALGLPMQAGSSVTVGGYASNEDPATLVLGATASSWNSAGTIGNKVNAAGAAGDPWATAEPGSYTAGTFGYLVSHLTVGTGSGANTITITVNDGTNPIENANVRLTNGAATFIGQTDVNGQIVFNLDDATWTVGITAFGYTFAGASLVVTTSANQTYSMSSASITPSGPGFTTGYLTCYDGSGNPEAGVEVMITVAGAGGVLGNSLDNITVTQTSNSSGVVQFPNLALGAAYRFQRGASGPPYVFTIPLAAGSTYQLPSIIGSP